MVQTKIPVALVRKMVKKQKELDALKLEAKKLGATDSYIRGLLTNAMGE